MNIELKSKKYFVKGIKKKTQAYMFKNIEVGDIIQLSTEVKYLGKGSGGASYAAPVEVTNLTKNESSMKTFNTLPMILNCFELVED